VNLLKYIFVYYELVLALSLFCQWILYNLCM